MGGRRWNAKARWSSRSSNAATAIPLAARAASAARPRPRRDQLTHDQLVRQVIQGGGNMPAYGKNLTPAEVTALVSFLETLHPPNQPPARDASQGGGDCRQEQSAAPANRSLASHAACLSSRAAFLV